MKPQIAWGLATLTAVIAIAACGSSEGSGTHDPSGGTAGVGVAGTVSNAAGKSSSAGSSNSDGGSSGGSSAAGSGDAGHQTVAGAGGHSSSAGAGGDSVMTGGAGATSSGDCPVGCQAPPNADACTGSNVYWTCFGSGQDPTPTAEVIEAFQSTCTSKQTPRPTYCCPPSFHSGC
jgi:hypothetical protein